MDDQDDYVNIDTLIYRIEQEADDKNGFAFVLETTEQGKKAGLSVCNIFFILN